METALALMRREGIPVPRAAEAHSRVSGVLFLDDVAEVLFGAVEPTG